MKRIWLLLLLILSTLLLSGCWDIKEVNEVSVVSGLAFDKGKEKQFRITIELLNPNELSAQTSSGNTASIVLGVEGDSIRDISHRLNEAISRKPIFSHMKTMFISEEIAEEGIKDLFDALDRDREIRNDFNIIVVEKPHTAADGLRITYPLQKVSTLKLNTQAENLYEEWGGDPNVRLKDVIDSLVSHGKEPVVAMVKIIGDDQKASNAQNLQNTTPSGYLKINGLALFKDGKLIGKLPISGTRNYLITQNQLKRTSYYITCEKEKTIDFFLKDIRVKSSVKMKQNKPSFKFTIIAEGDLQGTQCPERLSSFVTTQEYEERLSKKIEEDFLQTIKLVQEEYKSDIFGLGELFYKSYPMLFKKVQHVWNEEFTSAEVDVKASVQIRRNGFKNDSYISEIENKEVEK
ncbi:Ger(x)C family spore germination protein [Cytobacillus gottheilii]|uniref:Ger(x)C family spore germination protein n=1 Tax=Cytobacillus gottheilii TaxID=859144 RepID=UPI003CEC2B79